MKRMFPARLRATMLVALIAGVLSVTASPARADNGFSLRFSDAISQPGNPALYSATVSFHVVGSHLVVDVHNTSTASMSELGFRLNPELKLTDPVLSGLGTSGFNVVLERHQTLSTFGLFDYDFVLGGKQGGQLGASDWEITTDIGGVPPSSLGPRFSFDSRTRPTKWYGAIHFSTVGNQPALFGASSTESGLGSQSLVPEGSSMAMLGAGLFPFLGAALLQRRRLRRART